MSAPTRDVLTTQEKIVINWLPLSSPQNGDDSITSQNLQWFYNNQWRNLVGILPGSITTQFELTSNIERGITYQFRVRSENSFGWGVFSNITSIKAAGIPYQMDTLVTSIDELTGGVIVTWLQPDDNSQQLMNFTILIGSSNDMTFFEDKTNCDGSDPQIT